MDDYFAKNMQAENANDIDSMHKLFSLATAGDVDAQEKIGDKYAYGWGMPMDKSKAIYWYKRASEQGSCSAQIEMLRIYSDEMCCKYGLQDAMDWWRKLAEKGDKTALHVHGLIYYWGVLVPRDLNQAFDCLMKAALQHNPYVHFRIGHMYEFGEGVRKNSLKAKYWYDKVAEGMENPIRSEFWFLGRHGLGIDDKETFFWLHNFANKGDSYSQYKVGNMYAKGKCVVQDFALALLWYKKAELQNESAACFSLGQMYEQGIGVEKDYEQAVIFYLKANNIGCYSAEPASRLGQMYAEGLGVNRDILQAIKWHRIAAENEFDGNDFSKKWLINIAYQCLTKGEDALINYSSGLGVLEFC